MKNAFVLYYDLDEVFGFLTDEEAGQLIKAVFAYEIRGEVREFSDRMMQSSYKRITDNLDRNKQRYEDICRRRKEAADKRWSSETEADKSDFEGDNCPF